MVSMLGSPLKGLLNNVVKKEAIAQENPLLSQNRVFQSLRHGHRGTKITKELGIEDLEGYEEFVRYVPPKPYEFFEPYINETIEGNTNLLFRSKLDCLGVTSGTTGVSQKLIPINLEMIKLIKWFQRLMFAQSVISEIKPKLNKKILIYSNSHKQPGGWPIDAYYATGLLAMQTSWLMRKFLVPPRRTMEILDWDTKISEIADETQGKNISVLNGIPIYIKKMLQDLSDIFQVRDFKDLWPNLNVCYYGGGSIQPYQDEIDNLVGRNLLYKGIYFATESPIGYSVSNFDPDDTREAYRLLLGNILYSFSEQEADGKVRGIHELEIGKRYSLNIGTPNGLLHYQMKDIVQVLSLSPYPLFKIIGRDKVGMNVAYEKYSESDIHSAMKDFSRRAQIKFNHYFVYPSKIGSESGYCCELVLPNQKLDLNIDERLFEALDQSLKKFSEHYRECRDREQLIAHPVVKLFDNDTLDRCFLKHHTKGQFKLRHCFESESKFREYVS